MNKILAGILMAIAVPMAQAEVLRIGTDPTYPPYESYNTKGELVGVDVEIGNYVCKELKVECKWVALGFDSMIPALKAKKIDMILSSMSITPAREKVVAFSHPIYITTTRLMVNKDSPELEPTVESLKGKTIGVGAGTIQAAYAKKFWQPHGIKVVDFDNDQLAKQDLVLGRVDATLQDTAAAEGFFETEEGRGFKLTGAQVYDAQVFGGGIAMAMRKKDKSLVKRVNAALEKMKAEGTYEQVLSKYAKYGILDPNTQF